jgi:hypothetical protein
MLFSGRWLVVSGDADKRSVELSFDLSTHNQTYFFARHFPPEKKPAIDTAPFFDLPDER